MLLGQQDVIMHAYPLVAFKVSNFTSHGYSCMPDKVPVDRKLTFPVASNLYKDAEELLRNLHLAPYLKPVVSLIDDFPTHQKHKGWQFGYLINDTSKQVRPRSLGFRVWGFIRRMTLKPSEWLISLALAGTAVTSSSSETFKVTRLVCFGTDSDLVHVARARILYFFKMPGTAMAWANEVACVWGFGRFAAEN